MNERETLADGQWCRKCKSFEDPDDEGGSCPSCGCPEGDHIAAQVVVSR